MFVVLAKHEIAPWRWFLHEPKLVGAMVGILIVLIFLWFYNWVHQFGIIKKMPWYYWCTVETWNVQGNVYILTKWHFYTTAAVLIWFDSMVMVPCGPKHVGIFSVILLYKYLRSNFGHFVGLMSWISYRYNERNEQYKIRCILYFMSLNPGKYFQVQSTYCNGQVGYRSESSIETGFSCNRPVVESVISLRALI